LSLPSSSPSGSQAHAVADSADVLVHDSQYSEDEYAERVGWGHSSVADAVAFAQKARVGRLVLFHHDRLAQHAAELWNGNGGPPPLAACEGMTIELG
jgi:ribonuclease BN (tRNA processing enzyme)